MTKGNTLRIVASMLRLNRSAKLWRGDDVHDHLTVRRHRLPDGRKRLTGDQVRRQADPVGERIEHDNIIGLGVAAQEGAGGFRHEGLVRRQRLAQEMLLAHLPQGRVDVDIGVGVEAILQADGEPSGPDHQDAARPIRVEPPENFLLDELQVGEAVLRMGRNLRGRAVVDDQEAAVLGRIGDDPHLAVEIVADDAVGLDRSGTVDGDDVEAKRTGCENQSVCGPPSASR